MLDIEGHWLTADDRHILRHPEVGGLILFARNVDHPAQVRELCAAIRRIRPDLLLAIDQEGGRVQRIRQGFVRLPSMLEIGSRSDSVSLARHCGWIMATEVLSVGLDFSFAPVLDIDHQRNSVIGSRSFGGDADTVTHLAHAFIQGMHSAGMAATGKHFPGHGWVDVDSHIGMPCDDRPFEEIRRTDMQPFIRLAHELDAIMPAHIVFTQVDDQPAGFSRQWLQDVLREQLTFEGVIFSDDLSMAGAQGAGDAGQRIESALRAGCDMGLVCNDRASAELALTVLQRLRVQPSPRLQRMRGQGFASTDYRQQPRWSMALTALQKAHLV